MRSIRLPSPVKGVGHAAPITHVTFSRDGSQLATSSYDGNVVVWDSHNPARLQQVACLKHRRLVNAAAWNPVSPRLLATASADKTVTVWDVALDGSIHIVSVLARHTDDINSVAWLPDGRRLACVSEDGTATLWDGLSGRFLDSLVAHAGHCMMVAVSSQGWVSTVGEDGLVTVLQVDGDGPVGRRTYDGSVEGCAWSQDGFRLAVARDDGYVDVLHPDLSTALSVKVSSTAARSVAWMDEGSALVVGSYDGTVRFLRLDGTCFGQFQQDRVWPRCVATAPGVAAVGSFWSTPYLYDTVKMTEIPCPGVPTNGPNALTVQGRNLLVGCDSGAIVEIDLESVGSGRMARHRLHRAGNVPILSVATIGDDIYAGTFTGQVIRIKGAEKQTRYVGAPVPSLLSDGDRIIGGTYRGEVVACDSRTFEISRRNRPHEGSIKSIALLAPGAFVSGATDRLVAVGDLDSRMPLWEHGNLVNAVATLAGELVASASRDHTVKIGRVLSTADGTWQVTTQQTFLGPDESVKSLTLLGTADRPLVLAGSYDFGLYAWAVDWDKPGEALRAGSLVNMFDQAVSSICRIDQHTAAVASWSGQTAIIRIQDDKVEVAGELDLNHLVRGEMISI